MANVINDVHMIYSKRITLINELNSACIDELRNISCET